MNSGVGGAAKVWHCAYCDARNVTVEADLFSDQCENCTRYNDVDWASTGDVTMSEAKAAASGVEAK